MPIKIGVTTPIIREPGPGADAVEVLEGFVGQFYVNKEPPRLVVLSHPPTDPELVNAMLSERRGGPVKLVVPKRGEKAVLIENAVRNARESLAFKMSERATQLKLLEGLASALGIDAKLQRVEVYDNSHVQGKFPVGAMIVVGPDGFMKSSYRKYNFKSSDLVPGDDFGMMREVFSRRFRHLNKAGADSGDWPDLVVIDGGKGQVSSATKIMEKYGVTGLPVVGVSKGPLRDAGREEFHFPDGRRFKLGSSDPVLYFVQRIRDEAHRFAIGAHRAKRKKSAVASPLQEVPGVGIVRKRALLAHFGSARAVSRAGIDDLKAVDGISEQLARQIYAFLPGTCPRQASRNENNDTDSDYDRAHFCHRCDRRRIFNTTSPVVGLDGHGLVPVCSG